jgi:hypothetical protein
MPIDLADAIYQTLRNKSQVVQAFGDTWDAQTETGVSKFWGDYADQVGLPYIVEFEPREDYQDMTRIPGQMAFIADGDFQLLIFASSRTVARQLGELVIDTLQNAPIYWPGVNPMDCRIKRAAFVPRTGIGPGSSSVFQRALTFGYEYNGVRFFPPLGGNP